MMPGEPNALTMHSGGWYASPGTPVLLAPSFFSSEARPANRNYFTSTISIGAPPGALFTTRCGAAVVMCMTIGDWPPVTSTR
jgi:hypothetical protein